MTPGRRFSGIAPSITKISNGLLLAYGAPANLRSGFGLETRKWDGSSWSAASIVVRDSTKSVQRTALFTSNDGLVHMAWMSTSKDGTSNIILKYAFSEDEGESWSAPVLVFKIPLFFSGSPRIVEDASNRIHLLWGHHDTPPKQRFFHSMLIDGKWTEPVEPFSDLPSVSTRKVAVTENGDIHVAWRTEYTLFHAVYR